MDAWSRLISSVCTSVFAQGFALEIWGQIYARFEEMNYHQLLYIQLCFTDPVEHIPIKKAKIEETKVTIFQLTPGNIIFFLATAG